jgi:hypothetical protein
MLSTTTAKSLADDPPIGNTDNINFSESVQFNFLNANLHDKEKATTKTIPKQPVFVCLISI